jgi:hypothetical protein
MITKEAQEALDTAKQALSKSAQQAGGVSDVLSNLGDSLGDYKGPALSALIGALLGGTAGGGMSLLSGEGGTVGNTLTGGLLGGLAGGAGHLGYNYLSGRNNPGGGTPKPLPWADRANNAIADTTASNIGGIAGGLAGTALAAKNMPTEAKIRQAISRVNVHKGTPGASILKDLSNPTNRSTNLLHRLIGSPELRRVADRARGAGTRVPGKAGLLSALAIPAGAYAGNALQNYLMGRD